MMSDDTSLNRKIYELSDLAASLKATISKTYQGRYWIKAEIAKLNFYPKSGHCYPDLVEKSDHKVKAQMRAIIWADDFFRINQEFLKVTNEPLKEGIAILFMAGITYSPVYGLSLQIYNIEPSFTLGKMAQQKNETIKKLKEAKLFDLNRSLPFPKLPKTIAIISVETSKGYHDFNAIMKTNEFGFAFHYKLFPSLLQGDQAVNSMLLQLDEIRKYANLFDAVLIIRGGGGDVGLSCYDHFLLASAVASFPIPVITGIGHSTNETVVEMVAYANKITPTDVAYFLLSKFLVAQQEITDSIKSIFENSKNLLRFKQNWIQNISRQFSASSTKMLHNSYFLLQLNSSKLQKSIHQRQNLERINMQKFQGQIVYFAENQFQKYHSQIQNQQTKLKQASVFFISRKKEQLFQVESKLKLLDPVNVLKRGYSITKINGKSLRNAGKLSVNDELRTILYNGEIISIVQKIIKNKRDEN
ncbi:MAG: exodeoxyribonuclease VII large subunit [Bacteroidales bacterium]|nr:exodeoxyribonuclease VII large subunit [Bacteroidales bacterium]